MKILGLGSARCFQNIMSKRNNVLKGKIRFDIQALRGVSVFWVVLFHLEPERFPLGHLGVDIFFAISGFVMAPTFLYENRSLAQLREFYRRRFWRLAPAFTSVVVVFILLIFIFGPIIDHQRIARQALFSMLGLGNISAVRYSGDYFSPNPNPFLHTWSLAVEEQFYLLIPLIIFLTVRTFKNKKGLNVVTLSSIGILSLFLWLFPAAQENLYSPLGIGFASDFSFYSPLGRAWEFVVGIFAYLVHRKFCANLNARILQIMPLILLATVTIILGIPGNFNTRTLVLFLLTLVFLQFVLGETEGKPNPLLKPLAWVGNRSYSIYLVHLPIIYLLTFSPIIESYANNNHFFVKILSLAASFFMGHVLFRYVETRFRYRYLNRVKKFRSIRVAIVTFLFPALLLASVDTMAGGLVLQDSKFPPQDKKLRQEITCLGVKFPSSENDLGCRYGSGTGKSIFLIGDSHASANLPAIKALSSDYELTLYDFSRPGCGFFLAKNPDYSKIKFPLLSEGCIKHNLEIVAQAKDLNPTLVFYASRSTLTLVSPSNTSTRFSYNQQIRNNLLQLKSVVGNIAILGSESEYLPAASAFQILLKKEGKWSNVPFEDRSYWQTNSGEDFRYIDTLDVLCPNLQCINRIENEWIFSDGHHLSEFGSYLLKAQLREVFAENFELKSNARPIT